MSAPEVVSVRCAERGCGTSYKTSRQAFDAQTCRCPACASRKAQEIEA